MGNSNSSGMMIMLLMVGGGCFLCLCLSAGLLAAYNMSDSFKTWVQDTFKFGDGKGGDGGEDEISDLAGQWACPMIGDVTYTKKDNGDWAWCEASGHNSFLASRLPDDATVGKTYTATELQALSPSRWGPDMKRAKGSDPKTNYIGYDPLQNGVGGSTIIFTA